MTAQTMTKGARTVAELLRRLSVPAERVLLDPRPGAATESDLLRGSRLCELIDGVLVEKASRFYGSRWAVALIHFVETYLDHKPIGFTLDGNGMCRVEPEQVRCLT